MIKFPHHNAFTTRFSGRAEELKSQISVSEAYHPSSGLPPPPRRDYVAVWDTGAMHTVIRKKVAQDLGILPSGKIDVEVVGEGDDSQLIEGVPTYVVNLYLPSGVGVIGVPVSEGGTPGCDVLLGMDVVTMGDFAITHYQNGFTCMSFVIPSSQTIDFVSQINEYKFYQTRDGQRKLRNERKRERKKKR